MRCLISVAVLSCKFVNVACFVEVKRSEDPSANEFDRTLGAFPAKNMFEDSNFAVIGLFTNCDWTSVYAVYSEVGDDDWINE